MVTYVVTDVVTDVGTDVVTEREESYPATAASAATASRSVAWATKVWNSSQSEQGYACRSGCEELHPAHPSAHPST